MPALSVNPTRQELTRLKARLKTSIRGHKLLKDKRDGLMKEFMDAARENRALRAGVEEALQKVYGSFSLACALMSPEAARQALLYPGQRVELDVTFQNIMSVNVPEYHFRLRSGSDRTYPYGFAFTSGELDAAVDRLSQLLPDLLKLAQAEKTVQLLAGEIEKTRRRVNALEHVKIPQMQEDIRYISMKLDENARANTVRLMKVKEMILKDAMTEKSPKRSRLWSITVNMYRLKGAAAPPMSFS